MLTITSLQEQLDELSDKADAIVAVAEDETRELTADETGELHRIQGKDKDDKGEIGKIEARLVDLQKIENRKKQIAAQRVTRDGLIPGIGSKEQDGIDLSAVRIPAAARKYSPLKAFKTPEAAYASARWLQACFSQDEEMRNESRQWCRDHGIWNVATTTNNTNAGYLVPDLFEMPIIELRDKYGIARQETMVWPMSSDTDHAPKVIGDLSVYFVGELDATPESDMAFGQVKLQAKELAGLTRISKNLNEDAMVNMADLIARSFGRALAEKEDRCLFLGDGTSTYGGIVGLAGGIQDGSLITTATNIDTFAELTIGDFQAAMGLLRDYAGASPKWYMNKVAWHTAFKRLAFAAGGNDVSNYEAGMRPVFEGHPVVFTNVLPGTSSTTDHSGLIFAYFGDLELSVTLGNRSGMTMDTTTERYFEYRQIGLQVTQRFDINFHDRGTATESGGVIGLKFNAS